MDGTYSPGYRLVLAKIAEDLGVSVVPVREAIRRLEAEGLVKFERNVGATVSGIDPTEYLYTMQTLSIVEGAATALSAPLHRGGGRGPRPRRQRARCATASQHFDPVRFTRLNQDFHSVLFEHCPNPHILDLVHRGWNRLASLRDLHVPLRPGPRARVRGRARGAPAAHRVRRQPRTRSRRPPAGTAAPPSTRTSPKAPRGHLAPIEAPGMGRK